MNALRNSKARLKIMKNINWRLRFQNKATLLAIASTVILLIQQLGFKLPDNIADVVNTFLTLLVLLGVINDPTTEGISDSPKALTYTEPKKGLGGSNEKE